jgi:ATP phosphoribosyltransferase
LRGKVSNHPLHQQKIGGVFTDQVGNKNYAFVKSSDILSDLNNGFADVGFVGSDKIDEQQLAGRWRNIGDQIVASAKCDLVVAGGDQYGRVGKRIATSYPYLPQRWLHSRMWGYKPDIVVTPSGSVEAYVGMAACDTVVDIRESGKTLADNELAVLEEIEPISTKLVWREGDKEPELDVNGLYAALSRINGSKRPVGYYQEDRHLIGKSVTAKLFNSRNALVKKLGEEVAEVIQDVVKENGYGLVLEASDLIYVLSVALCSQGKSLIEVLNNL